MIIRGGAKEELHRELRELMCHNADFGVCNAAGKKITVLPGVEGTPGERLGFDDADPEQCNDPNADKKKKKKKAKAKAKSPIEDF